jgi:hypothetical protein
MKFLIVLFSCLLIFVYSVSDINCYLFFLVLQALEKAKEAGRKERVLVRQREQQAMGEQINLDLTYSV